jgi:tRNA G10  N-methylase Trm11
MSSQKYIVILGRQPELGFLELESLVGAEHLSPFGAAALLDDDPGIDRLGGAIKVGEVLWRGRAEPLEPGKLPIDTNILPMRDTKTPVALSVYGSRQSKQTIRAVAFGLKKIMRERGSVRLVVPAETMAVSAAELHHNQVLEHGFELLVVVSGADMIVAKTVGVQNIDWYSKRDYGRPVRSATVGMLPPKLAQVLVNSTSGSPVVDPFVGTGVVLQEALLVGRSAAGFDTAPDMVSATQQNLDWLVDQTDRDMPEWSVAESDARDVVLPPDAVIVSEGYLGPNLSKSPTAAALVNIKADLLRVYEKSLANWSKQLPSGAEVTICAPAWRSGSSWSYLGLVDELPRLGYALKGFKYAPNPLLYARGDQTVGRQLLILRKI